MKTEKRFIPFLRFPRLWGTVIALVAVGMVSASHAQTILIDRTFDGVANDTGPAVQAVDNGTGTGDSVDLTTGLITTGNNVNSGNGINNVSTVSLAGYTSFTATFVIDSITLTGGGQVANLLANGLFFGVVAGTNANSNTSFFGANETTFGYIPGSVNRGSHVVSTRVSSDTTVNDGIASTQPTNASLIDGFTVSLTLNSADAWTISSTGLSTELSDSGSRSGLWTAMSGGVGLWSGIQGNAGGQLNLSSMTLTAIPEPSTVMLLGLSALGLLTYRLRRR